MTEIYSKLRCPDCGQKIIQIELNKRILYCVNCDKMFEKCDVRNIKRRYKNEID